MQPGKLGKRGQELWDAITDEIELDPAGEALLSECCRTFGTERPLVDGTTRVAFDVDDVVAAGVHQLRTANGAVRADAGSDLVSLLQAWTRAPRFRGFRGIGICALAL